VNGKIKLAGIALVVALIVGLFGVVAVSAQDDDGTLPNIFGRGRGRMGGYLNGGLVDQDAMHEAIADALGISAEELDAAQAEGTSLFALADELGADMTAVREAMESVRQAAIDQAVADGVISQEQAEQFGNGRGPWRHGPAGPFYGEGPGMNLVDADVMHAAIADALGISVEELDAARAEGTSLVALAEELGVEIETVREAMEAVREDAINQALADGVITEEQAEWLLSRPAVGQGNGPLGGRGPGNGDGPMGGQGPCGGEGLAGGQGPGNGDGPMGGRGPGGGNGPQGNTGNGRGNSG